MRSVESSIIDMNIILNTSISQQQILKLNPASLVEQRSFCRFHDLSRTYSYNQHALNYKDSKGLSYFQKADMINRLLPCLQGIGYHRRLPVEELRLIGYVINYYTLLILVKVQPGKHSCDRTVNEELKRVYAVRKENMRDCLEKGGVELGRLRGEYQGQVKDVERALKMEFKQQAELHPLFTNILLRIQTGLKKMLKQSEDREHKQFIIKALLRTTYTILLPKLNPKDGDMLKYFNKWKLKQPQNMALFSLEDLQRYFEEGNQQEHLADINHIIKVYL